MQKERKQVAGEQEAIEVLARDGYKVVDVSNHPAYWLKDIDLLCSKGQVEESYEVKWDGRIANTGNLFIETCSDVDKNKKGWYGFCQATFVLYGDSINRLFYKIPFQSLVQYINENNKSLKQATAHERGWYGEDKRSIGYLVPIARLQE